MDLNINTILINTCTLSNLSTSNINLTNISNPANLGLTNITTASLIVTGLTTISKSTATTLNISGQTTLQSVTASSFTVTSSTVTNLTVTTTTVSNLAATSLTSSSLNVSSQPFHISYASVQSVTHNTAPTVLFATTPTNSGISFASGVCTVSSPGWYSITGSFDFAVNNTGLRNISLQINSVEVQGYTTIPPTNSVCYLRVNGVYKLAASDTIKMTGYQANGSSIALNIEATTNAFTVIKLF